MVKEREQLIENISGFLYVFVTIFCLIIAYSFWYDFRLISLQTEKEYLILILTIIPTWLILINATNLTKVHRVKSYTVILLDHLIMISLGMGVLFLVIFIFKLDSISRAVVFTFLSINFLLLYILHVVTYFLIKKFRKKGFNTRNVLIVADEDSEEIIEKIINNTFWGYVIKVIITDSEYILNKYIINYSVLPLNTNIDKFIEIEAIDELIYCKKEYNNQELIRLIYSCQEIGVVFRMQSHFYSMIASKSYITYLDQAPFFTFSKTPNNYIALKFKSLFDFLFSLTVLILSSPFMLIISLLIKTTSKGPIIFSQERVGLRGRRFKIYKFRTMVQNAEALKDKLMDKNEQDGPVFKIKDDPRITKIGKFLRKTSLDEFPQFLNVLKGDMSVVGPRPPVPKEVAQYERWQLRRLSMKPGITCIWQVSGRNNISFDQWMKLDLQYIDSWSLKLDLILFLKTFKAIFKPDGL